MDAGKEAVGATNIVSFSPLGDEKVSGNRSSADTTGGPEDIWGLTERGCGPGGRIDCVAVVSPLEEIRSDELSATSIRRFGQLDGTAVEVGGFTGLFDS